MRNKAKRGKEKSQSGVHIWLVMMKASQAIMKLSMSGLQKSGLCESDFRVLEVLLHLGGLPVNVIGPKVNLTPGSISVAVDRLHSRGLVTRLESQHDRRVRIVELTDAGREIIEPVFRQHAELLENVFGALSQDERSTLESLLKKAGRNAEALANDPLIELTPDEI